MNVLDTYAADVVAGRIPAGKYHRLACARHQRDRAREGTPDFPYRFDLARAERFFRFAEKLKHYKGEWAGQFIKLEPWQRFITGSVIGWVHVDTGLRRFRLAFTQVPRKNGKTLIAAVLFLYLTFFDNEPGAEGYSFAMKRDQARIVFDDAKALVESSGLKDRIKVLVSNMHRPATASKMQPLSADHDSMDGLNPHIVVGDEIHAMKDGAMISVMKTATMARRQALLYFITTFGFDVLSPWGDYNDYSQKVVDQVLTDETFFCFTASADIGDDWTLPDTARKANPNYGISVKPEDLAAKVVAAKGIVREQADYKQKNLNMLVSDANPCLSVEGWRKGQWKRGRAEFMNELKHQSCWVGIDLASKIDLCALSFVFPPAPGQPGWRLIQHIWTPDETLVDRAHRDRAPYLVWRDQGWLKTTPGTRIDHNVVRETLLEARKLYDIERIGYDPWHADKLIEDLKADGFAEEQLLEVPQTFAGMSSACLRMQADILAGDVDAGGCPVTAWAVSNVVDKRDGKDNMQFEKKKSRGRIDPVIAATIGMALAIREPAKVDTSVMAEWL